MHCLAMTPFMQFTWLLNVMRTVKEGLTRGDEEGDTTWEPESAFGRIRDKLAIEYSEHVTDQIGRMIAEFREIIETLDSKALVDKEKVLTMLYSLTRTMSFMDQLSEFLVVEIERYKSVEV